MQPHQLVGTWKPLFYEARFSDGRVDYPWGRDAEGLLICTYASYGGSYELQGNKLIHHVLVSLFPNWVGQPQIRVIEHLQGDHLTLATEPMTFAGQTAQGFFHWKRAEEAGR